MSQTTDNKNLNPNGAAADANQQAQNDGNGNNNGKPAPAKEFFLVRGFKWIGRKVSDVVEVAKEHPVIIAGTALLGTVGGGIAGYKIGSAVANAMMPTPEPEQQPQLPEPEQTQTEEDKPNPVEYVDIPQVPTETTETE